MPVRRAIAVLALSCIFSGAAGAQGAPDTLLSLRPRSAAIMDTVLFRLPRANILPSALVTLELRPVGARYQMAPPPRNGVHPVIEVRCLHAARRGERRETFELSAWTDSATIYTLRPASGSCELGNRPSMRLGIGRDGK
jgi:hypothetical protein